MKATLEQAKEWAKRGLIDQKELERLTSSTQTASSLSQPKFLPLSLPCKSSSRKGPSRKTTPRRDKGENKTELEYRRILETREVKNLQREALKLRIGPPNQRCWYTPDYTYIDHNGLFTLCEVKGPYEQEDARVKRMAAAEWCASIGFMFVFAQKKDGQWKEEELA